MCVCVWCCLIGVGGTCLWADNLQIHKPKVVKVENSTFVCCSCQAKAILCVVSFHHRQTNQTLESLSLPSPFLSLPSPFPSLSFPLSVLATAPRGQLPVMSLLSDHEKDFGSLIASINKRSNTIPDLPKGVCLQAAACVAGERCCFQATPLLNFLCCSFSFKMTRTARFQRVKPKWMRQWAW